MLALSAIAQVDSALTTIYWVALVVGGGLLLISTFAGGDTDVDVDADLDLDLDTDIDLDTDAGHAHAGHAVTGSLATWFSTQFVVFFLAMFGVVGVVLTYTTDQTWPVTLSLAVVGGVLIGQGAHQVLRAIKKTSGDSTPDASDYVNKLGRVTIPVAGKSIGQIMMRIGQTDRYVTARAQHETDAFAVGDAVGVVGYQNGVAEIVSRKEYEFINEGKQSRATQKEGS